MKKIHILPLLNGFGKLDKIAFVPCTVIDYDMVHIPLMDDSMWKCLKPFNSIKNMANDPKLIEKMLVVIKKIAQTKQEVNKASNQIAAYEIGQQMGELVDELVSLYDEIEQK